MSVGGISIILILGLGNLILLLFQAASGLKIIKVKYGIHKKTGIALLIIALIHGFLGIVVS
jgi:hypothetical protein